MVKDRTIKNFKVTEFQLERGATGAHNKIYEGEYQLTLVKDPRISIKTFKKIFIENIEKAMFEMFLLQR